MFRHRFVFVTFCFFLAQTNCRELLAVCITNCVQCKQMFGRFFEGQACGDACLLSNGLIAPDCNNPGSIGKYLKRLY